MISEVGDFSKISTMLYCNIVAKISLQGVFNNIQNATF